MTRRILLASSLTLVAACGVHAQTATYTDRAAFLTAAGTPSFEETFEAFTEDLLFANATTDAVNGFSMVSSTPFPNRPVIDVAPFQFEDDRPFNNGTPHVSAFTESENAVPSVFSIVFDEPAAAAGFDFITFTGEFSGTERFFVAALDATAMELARAEVAIQDGERFLGFTTSGTGPIASLRFFSADGTFGEGQERTGTGFTLDNVVGVSVPEPATAMVFGAGLLAVLARRHRCA